MKLKNISVISIFTMTFIAASTAFAAGPGLKTSQVARERLRQESAVVVATIQSIDFADSVVKTKFNLERSLNGGTLPMPCIVEHTGEAKYQVGDRVVIRVRK